MKKFGVLTLTAFVISSCSMLDHTFAPTIKPTTLGKPAPYHAPAVTGKRKTGNPYQILGKTYYPLKSSEGYRRKGIASWYGKDFHGKKTANGETYNMYAMTAAHPTLPIPTYVRVTNIENGLSTIVRVNDRGPFLRGRIIDLSYAAASTLGMAEKGKSPVLLEALPTDGSTLNVRSDYAKHENNVTNHPSKRYTETTLASAANTAVKETAPAPVNKNSFTYRISKKSNTSNTITNRADDENIPADEEIKIGSHSYYIQTGAFSNKENAFRQQQKVSKFYSNVKLMSFVRGTTQLHRVRIGPVSSVDEADEILGKIAQEGWTGARIVVD
ncbi:MAG: RlpA-like protein [Proteobacteria bacterium]|nr:MAG: RlpA-like protein [Pseudomonadota bacterium]